MAGERVDSDGVGLGRAWCCVVEVEDEVGEALVGEISERRPELARASSGIGSAWLGSSRRWKKGGEGERGRPEGIRLGVRAGA